MITYDGIKTIRRRITPLLWDLLTANSSSARAGAIYRGMLAGLIFCRFCAGERSCCVFINAAMVRSCLDTHDSQSSSSSSRTSILFYQSSSIFPGVFVLGADTVIPFRDKESTVFFFFHITGKLRTSIH